MACPRGIHSLEPTEINRYPPASKAFQADEVQTSCEYLFGLRKHLAICCPPHEKSLTVLKSTIGWKCRLFTKARKNLNGHIELMEVIGKSLTMAILIPSTLDMSKRKLLNRASFEALRPMAEFYPGHASQSPLPRDIRVSEERILCLNGQSTYVQFLKTERANFLR